MKVQLNANQKQMSISHVKCTYKKALLSFITDTSRFGAYMLCDKQNVQVYNYITVNHVPKCMSCHKAIAVITGKVHCFHNYIYITPILLL